MNTKIVRNISENELVIPEVGAVKAGETISVPTDFNNPNFQEVSSVDAQEVESKSVQKRKALTK